MDAEVWGFEFEEVMSFFPINVSDLEPNRGLQTRYCSGMMVDFDHSFLIPVKLFISSETLELREAVGIICCFFLARFVVIRDCWVVFFVVLEHFEEGAIFCAEG